MQDDKQLHVLEKRRLDQALNAKEFAVAAGVSYSTARQWFHLPGFPVFHGVVFWQDFEAWRMAQNGSKDGLKRLPERNTEPDTSLPQRAARILQAA
jgi:hypothetical protein